MAAGFGYTAQPDNNPERAKPVEVPCDVWSLAVTKDGQFLAGGAGYWDQPGEIGVWNMAQRKPLQHFIEDRGVASVAFSPDGRWLASGSWSGHVRVYEWAARREVADFPVNGVARVAFSPQNALLAAACENKSVRLWDVASAAQVADLEGDLIRFHCVTFSTDGQRVLAGGGDWKPGGINHVAVWDVATQKQVLKLTGHANTVICIGCAPDGQVIATGSADRTVRICDSETGKLLKTLAGHTGSVESLAFSRDGKTLITGSHDRTIRLWDLASGRETGRFDAMPADVRAVSVTPDGTAVLAGGGRKTLKVFDLASHQELASLWRDAEPQFASLDSLPTTVSQASHGRFALWVAGGIALLVALMLLVAKTMRARRATASHAARP